MIASAARQDFVRLLKARQVPRAVTTDPGFVPADAIESEVHLALGPFETSLREMGVNEAGIHIAKRLWVKQITSLNILAITHGVEDAKALSELTNEITQKILAPKVQPTLRLVKSEPTDE